MKTRSIQSGERRTVRSFVRRTGRLTPSQQRAIETLWPDYGIEFDDAALDFLVIFGRDAPRVLEIGFGNGDTLVQQAASQPERDFIGIEVHEPGIGHCLIKMREAVISNLRVIAYDAIEVLEQRIPESSITRINLYFPDPWPKKRHHKRRIVQERFLDICAAALKSGGTLHIATDWANYAEHIDEVLAGHANFTCTERREHDGNQTLDRPETRFEQRGLRHGHRICDWSCACIK